MEEIIYLSVRTACAAYILYKVWQAKSQVKRICDALYAVSSSAQAEEKETPASGPPPEAEVMGGTQSVYLDENTGETGAPFLSLPLEKDFIGEETETPDEDVECTLDLERMRQLVMEIRCCNTGLFTPVPQICTDTDEMLGILKRLDTQEESDGL